MATDIRDQIRDHLKKNDPALLNANTQVHNVPDGAVSQETAAIHSRLVKTCGMLYGVPAAMLGEGTAAAKVETLLREYWKGLSQVLDDVLEPLSHRLLLNTNSFAVNPSLLIRGTSRPVWRLRG